MSRRATDRKPEQSPPWWMALALIGVFAAPVVLSALLSP